MAKGLTEVKQTRENVIGAFDPTVYDKVYRKLKRMDGLDSDATVQTSNAYGDQIPRYQDIDPSEMTLGRSSRMQTAANIAVSRVASRMPTFQFPQLDTLDAAIRQEVIRVTYHGEQNCHAPWHSGVASAFDDGDSIGYGAVEIWPIINSVSRMPQAQLQHVGCIDVAWDPHKRDPRESHFHCVQKWMSIEEAAARFGWKKAKAAARQVFESSVSQYVWSVRIIEAHDRSYGKNGVPTTTTFLGNIWMPPEDVFENPLGKAPLAFCVNYVKNKRRRPLGRVEQQGPDCETLWQLEQALLWNAMNGDGALKVDLEAVDPQDWEDFLERRTRFLRVNSALEGKGIERIPGAEISPVLLQAIQHWSQLNGQSSMTNDTQRGENTGDRKTATQILQEQNAAAMNTGWTLAMMLNFQMEVGALAVDVMRIGDRHPRVIDVMGANVPVNIPQIKASSLYAMLAEPSRIEINPDTITADDDKVQRSQDQAWLWQTFQSGLVGVKFDPTWWAEAWVRAGGKYDPRTALMQGQPMPGAAPPPQAVAR